MSVITQTYKLYENTQKYKWRLVKESLREDY